MPATAEQGFEVVLASRSKECHWIVRGTDDEATALATLAAEAPTTSGTLTRSDVEVKAVGPNLWEGRVTYGPTGGATEPLEEGETAITFETGGATQHILQSLATSDTSGTDGDDPADYGQAIGVEIVDGRAQVKGCEIERTAFRFSVTKCYAFEDLPAPGDVFKLTAKTNKTAFSVTDSRVGLSLSFAAGEVLFLGASFNGPRGDDLAEMTFRFAASPNREDVNLGGGTDKVDIGGWEYVWVVYKEAESSGGKPSVIAVPRWVYVEQVYEDGDFDVLRLGAGA